MLRLLLLCSLFVLLSCAKHPEVTTLERTSDTGAVSVEMEAAATYDRDDLPPGVTPDNVVSITPVTIDIDENTATPATEAVSGQPAKKHGKVTGKLYALKDGNVVADKNIAGAIGKPETIKPSYAWLWWVIGVVVSVVGLGWGVKQISVVFAPAAKVVSFFAGLFKRG